MKLAVLIYGEMRNVNECNKSLKLFLKNTDYDIFISCWDNFSLGKEIKTSKLYGGNNTNKENINVELIKRIYSPVFIKMYNSESENILRYFKNLNNIDTRYYNYFSQWYIKFQGYLNYQKYCIQNKKKYNYILLVRSDMYFLGNNLNLLDYDCSKLYHTFKNNDFMSNNEEKKALDIKRSNYEYIFNCFKSLLDKEIDLTSLDNYELINFNIYKNINSNCDIFYQHCDQIYLSKPENIEYICYSFVSCVLYNNFFQVEDEKANCFADITNKNKRIKFEIFNSNIFNIKKDFFPDDIKFKIYRL